MGEYIKPWDDKYKSTVSQSWDREKITIKRYGKEINLYDYIQSNKGDSEIEECLKKYGTLEPIQINNKEVYGEIKEAITLESSLNLEIKLKEIYNNLPAEIKEKFGNNYYNFKDNGLQYFENLVKQENKPETTPETTPEPTPEKGDNK